MVPRPWHPVTVPDDPTLPFFAYGIFQPGEIAFFQIRDAVAAVAPAQVSGNLRIRDGVPILDPDARNGTVAGWRIEFKDVAAAETAYAAIDGMEPKRQYRWTPPDGGMNVLAGRGRTGSLPMEDTAWSSWRDPAFNDALDVVSEVLEGQRNAWPNLKPFYRLQGAYLVLWASIERYASLRYGLGSSAPPPTCSCKTGHDQGSPGAGVMDRVRQIAEEPQVAVSLGVHSDAMRELEERKIFRSDNPRQSVKFNPAKPEQAILYLYQVRCNVTHRGKAQVQDWQLLHAATSEALRIFRDVLSAAERDAGLMDSLPG